MRSVSERSRHEEANESNCQRRLPDAPYNAAYFAQKHDIAIEQARELTRRIGRDRDKLNEAAAKLFRK